MDDIFMHIFIEFYYRNGKLTELKNQIYGT